MEEKEVAVDDEDQVLRTKMRKLVCDRCGRELTERQDIGLILEGAEAWQASVRARGVEPRGLFPCKNYVRCGGEMILIDKRNRFRLGGKTN